MHIDLNGVRTRRSPAAASLRIAGLERQQQSSVLLQSKGGMIGVERFGRSHDGQREGFAVIVGPRETDASAGAACLCQPSNIDTMTYFDYGGSGIGAAFELPIVFSDANGRGEGIALVVRNGND